MNIKLVSLLLAAAATVALLCSCDISKSEVTTSNKSQNSQAVLREEETVYLMSYSEGEGDSSKLFGNFKNPTEYGLNTARESRKLTDVPSEFEFSDKKFVYENSVCSLKNSVGNEIGTFYSVQDTYRSGDEFVRLLHGTNTVIYYFKPTDTNTNYIDKTNEEVKNIADSFLNSFFADTTLEKFQYEGIGVDVLNRYSVSYVKYIHGYRTDETISVWIDRSGEVSGYNGFGVNKYDTLAIEITKENIDAANNKLMEQLQSIDLKDFKVTMTRLTANTVGKVYLNISFTYTTDTGEVGASAYINI